MTEQQRTKGHPTKRRAPNPHKLIAKAYRDTSIAALRADVSGVDISRALLRELWYWLELSAGAQAIERAELARLRRLASRKKR